jgi:hypothetical protein
MGLLAFCPPGRQAARHLLGLLHYAADPQCPVHGGIVSDNGLEYHEVNAAG